MADNTNSANSSDTSKKQGGGSPWDDDIDLPEEEDKSSRPQVIGSLDPEEMQDKKPVPFNIPEEVLEEKVAKKIPASEVIGKTKPMYYTPKAQEPKAAPVAKPVLTVTKVQEQAETKPVAAEVSSKSAVAEPVRPISDNTKPEQQISPVAQPTDNISSEKPLQNIPEVGVSESANPQIATSVAPLAAENQTSQLASPAPLQTAAQANSIQRPEAMPSKPVITSASTGENNVNKEVEVKKPEAGIAELLRREREKDQLSENSAALSRSLPESSAPNNQALNKNDMEVPEKRSVDNNIRKSMDIKKPIASLDPKQETVAKPPQAPQVSLKPEAQSESVEKNVPKPAPEAKKTEKSLMSRFKPWHRKGVEPAKSVSTSESGKPVNSAPVPSSVVNPQASERKGLPKSPGKLVYAFSFLLLLAAGIYLTEIGLLAIGLEKVYGIVSMEQLWGGLPRNLEPALAKAAIEGQSNLTFKFQGKISATVDKSKKSPVTSPLVAFGGPAMRLADLSVAVGEKATLAQYDYYGSDISTEDAYSTDGVEDTTDEGSNTTTTTTSTDYSQDDSTLDTDVESPTSDQTIANPNDDQSSLESYVEEESTIKQLEFELSGTSTDQAISSSIDLVPIVGSKKRIDTISSKGSLYVQSSDIKYDEKAETGKWLEYKFPGFSSSNTLQDFFNIKFDQGFSTKGLRVSNEKLSDGRAYHYKMYNLEYGDSFSSYGLPSSAVDSVNGDIWIGVRDHLIKKVLLEITPSVSSSISKMTVELSFTDYGKENSIVLPSLSNVIVVSEPAISSGTETEDAGVDDIDNIIVNENPSARITSDATRDNDLQSIKAALIQYKSKNGRYPVSTNYSNLSLSGNILLQTLVPTYLSAIPADPNAASGWWYGYKSDGKAFTLSARFENIYDTEVTNVSGIYLHYVKN